MLPEILDKLRPEAIYFKLSANQKYGDNISVDDVIKVLKNINESYNAYVNAEYYNNLSNKIQDKNRLKKISTSLISENHLMVVDLKFESFGMAVVPNTVSFKNKIPNISKPLQWKKDVFEGYKKDVLNSNYNDPLFLENIETRYDIDQRQKIYKPILEGIVKNAYSEVIFGIGSPDYTIKIKKPTAKNYEKFISSNNSIISNKAESTRVSIAKVEIKTIGGVDKSRPKVLELFDTENLVIPIKEIKYHDSNYKFKYPLYCEVIHDENGYNLENPQIGIFAFGDSIEDAKLNFGEEFDYIFNRYNSTNNNLLTQDVIDIKNYINTILE